MNGTDGMLSMACVLPSLVTTKSLQYQEANFLALLAACRTCCRSISRSRSCWLSVRTTATSCVVAFACMRVSLSHMSVERSAYAMCGDA